MHISSAIFRERIQGFLDITGPNNRYSLTTVPDESTWGDGRLKNVLCVEGLPITLLVVGELNSVRAHMTAGPDRTTMFIGVELLRDVDRHRRDSLVARIGTKSLAVDDAFYASRGQASAHPLFSSIFDATEAYDSDRVMPKLTLHDVSMLCR
ncbi:hypothetical protein C2E23DRAFT_883193 [Lenzites betulinus]|nr:hypothetical protein C2E23DRAFT_883193 [Lenzites betulinus]